MRKMNECYEIFVFKSFQTHLTHEKLCNDRKHQNVDFQCFNRCKRAAAEYTARMPTVNVKFDRALSRNPLIRFLKTR